MTLASFHNNNIKNSPCCDICFDFKEQTVSVNMGKNYYCEYCDKRLKNDAQVIKKHIAGLAHTAARNEHYARYKGKYSEETYQ